MLVVSDLAGATPSSLSAKSTPKETTSVTAGAASR
jgi:hypothetical protein